MRSPLFACALHCSLALSAAHQRSPSLSITCRYSQKPSTAQQQPAIARRSPPLLRSRPPLLAAAHRCSQQPVAARKSLVLLAKARRCSQKPAIASHCCPLFGCTAVTMDQMKRMQQLIDDAELRKKNSKQKEVTLPSSFGSSNMASKSSFCFSGILQNDDPTKKRKGPLGPLEETFNLNARDKLHSKIARLFYTGGLSFNIARNPHYVRAFSLTTQRTIPGYLPPGYNLLRTSLLQKEKAHIGKLLEPTKAAWKQKGVSICSDGWSDVQRRPPINIMVVCKSGPMFLKTINCEGEYKDKAFISKLLINIINEVGHQNVVQVVTNNAPVCKAVGLLVEAKQIKKCLENMVLSERWDLYEDDVVKARLVKRSPHYNEGESKMWNVRVDGFDSMDMEGAAILEIANLSLDEPELESVLFTDEGDVGDETDTDV
ncbi:hypothetical protein ZIOFF_056022 [Zingiber officinale]|uniref:DUF659 domain-containing protein n=1 Tax=Zingiber officinale TaxID=94328 RepID=A0A8J5FXE6_ZINOF|nr:hypothetical protein ZIOFF_056022 [Zingiber officinale]